MKYSHSCVSAIAWILFCSIALAEQNPDNTAAMQQTQSTLTDPTARQNAINQSQSAKNADGYANKVLGAPQNVNEAYDIAAALLPWIMSQSNGDPVKMQKMLDDAQRDPQGFLNRMPASERARIKNLSAAAPQPTKP